MTLHPQWVSGFVDGEGTFYIGINKQSSMKTGFQILPEFRIVQHKKDVALLHSLKKFFKSGVVRVNHGDRYELRIRSITALRNTIVPFFEKYSLRTQKKFDFLNFRSVLLLMEGDQHLTEDGITKIFAIAQKMNRRNKAITRKHLMDKDIVRSSSKDEA
jgi:hypothetical protein